MKAIRTFFLRGVMPAVSVVRLQEQITTLIGRMNRPLDFYRALVDLLDTYGDHAYRAGESVTGVSILPSYHVPPLVWRQMEVALAQAAKRFPRQALDVIPLLWADEHREMRQIAAWMLGHIPISEAGAVVEILQQLVISNVDLTLLRMLLDKGTLTLRREGEETLLRLIENWHNHEQPIYRRAGLFLCEVLVSDPAWENLPAIFRLLQPLTEKPEPAWLNDLVVVFQKLAERSPSEVSYFLRQVLSRGENPMTGRLARKVASFLPEQMGERLKKAARQTSRASD